MEIIRRDKQNKQPVAKILLLSVCNQEGRHWVVDNVKHLLYNEL